MHHADSDALPGNGNQPVKLFNIPIASSFLRFTAEMAVASRALPYPG
jgi:hypothetical protein